MSRRAGERVRNFVRGLGGQVVFTKDNALLNAPFCSELGIRYHTGILYWKRGSANDMRTIVGAIHEAGHIFAAASVRDMPEELPFLGWEILVARKCGIPLLDWAHCNGDYSIHGAFDGFPSAYVWRGDIADIAAETLPILAEQAIRYSMTHKVVVDGAPISIRKDL